MGGQDGWMDGWERVGPENSCGRVFRQEEHQLQIPEEKVASLEYLKNSHTAKWLERENSRRPGS